MLLPKERTVEQHLRKTIHSMRNYDNKSIGCVSMLQVIRFGVSFEGPSVFARIQQTPLSRYFVMAQSAPQGMKVEF